MDLPQVVFAGAPAARDRARCERFGVAIAAGAAVVGWRLERVGRGIRLAAPDGLTIECTGRDEFARRILDSERDDPLAKAVGLRAGPVRVRVVDATAGLGRDALTLAQLGCAVIALERQPALAFWIDAVADLLGLNDRIAVHACDAVAWLRAMPDRERPDVVYLDPMFTELGTAQVRKPAQLLRRLAGNDPTDDAGLFAAAWAAAGQRVVVKRQPHAEPIVATPAPDLAIEGSRLRFDVYLRGPTRK